jgi:hypothetical protein
MTGCFVRSVAIGIFVAGALPGVAFAQESGAPAPVMPVTTVETTSQATGPSLPMVGTGVGIFALSYIPAVVLGATSGLNADQTLLVPVAGPWIDLTQRPGCAPNTSCNSENQAKAFLVIDGVFQLIGALTLVGGFLGPAHEAKTVRAAKLRPTLDVAPARLGAGGYGMVALGRF